MRIIGLCGAHRTGKTTLMNALGELTGHHYRTHPVNLSEIQKSEGYDSSNQDYDLLTRMNIQELLLNGLNNQLTTLRNRPEPAALRWVKDTVMDRTPIDLIGYAAYHVHKANLGDVYWLEDFTERCINLTNRYYDTVFFVQPGIPLIASPTSAPLDQDFIDQLNAVYLQQALNPKLITHKYIIPEDMLSVEDRVLFVKNHMDKHYA